MNDKIDIAYIKTFLDKQGIIRDYNDDFISNDVKL